MRFIVNSLNLRQIEIFNECAIKVCLWQRYKLIIVYVHKLAESLSGYIVCWGYEQLTPILRCAFVEAILVRLTLLSAEDLHHIFHGHIIVMERDIGLIFWDEFFILLWIWDASCTLKIANLPIGISAIGKNFIASFADYKEHVIDT